MNYTTILWGAHTFLMKTRTLGEISLAAPRIRTAPYQCCAWVFESDSYQLIYSRQAILSTLVLCTLS